MKSRRNRQPRDYRVHTLRGNGGNPLLKSNGGVISGMIKQKENTSTPYEKPESQIRKLKDKKAVLQDEIANLERKMNYSGANKSLRLGNIDNILQRPELEARRLRKMKLLSTVNRRIFELNRRILQNEARQRGLEKAQGGVHIKLDKAIEKQRRLYNLIADQKLDEIIASMPDCMDRDRLIEIQKARKAKDVTPSFPERKLMKRGNKKTLVTKGKKMFADVKKSELFPGEEMDQPDGVMTPDGLDTSPNNVLIGKRRLSGKRKMLTVQTLTEQPKLPVNLLQKGYKLYRTATGKLVVVEPKE